MNAFLFTWVDGDTECRPVRLPKVGNAAMAVIDRAELGPQFGPDGLKIALSPGRERLVRYHHASMCECFDTHQMGPFLAFCSV